MQQKVNYNGQNIKPVIDYEISDDGPYMFVGDRCSWFV